MSDWTIQTLAHGYRRWFQPPLNNGSFLTECRNYFLKLLLGTGEADFILRGVFGLQLTRIGPGSGAGRSGKGYFVLNSYE